MNDILVLENSFKKIGEGIAFWYKNLGNIATSQTKIPKNVLAQSF